MIFSGLSEIYMVMFKEIHNYKDFTGHRYSNNHFPQILKFYKEVQVHIIVLNINTMF